MNRSDGVGVFEVVSHPPSLGYVRRSAMERIQFDITAFVERGVLGPIGRNMGQDDLESILGPSTPGGYHRVIAFGNLQFELPNGTGPPCSPHIYYRHSAFDNDYADMWPDPRFNWNFGRYRLGLTITEFRRTVGQENAIIMEGEDSNTSGVWVHMVSSGVDLAFYPAAKWDEPTIAIVVGYSTWKQIPEEAEQCRAPKDGSRRF
ncbi:hypothetical protein LOC67_22535 [Stieleria sp. JC731]|uniref:hypothetical protein n=1 Tax=Stieleria sp. JC731 TaxID=2894195 RepID=UPI001E5AF094|nr:hypothetical protein [Stieleria sp. JC731]MCC9603337.1 hypothetical protein [Stieleria sp. JC731]